MCVRILVLAIFLITGSLGSLYATAMPPTAAPPLLPLGEIGNGNQLEASYTIISVEDGLPASRVNCVVQDSLGYTWFGTEAGLSRYDGDNIKNFSTEDGLTHNRIQQLHVDVTGRLWIISGGALCFRESGKFTRLTGPYASGITSVTSDTDGTLWLTSRDALFRIEQGSDKSPNLPHGTPSLEKVDFSYTWNNPLLKLSNRNGIWLVNRQPSGQPELVQVSNDFARPFPLRQPPHDLESIHLIDLDGQLYYNAEGGLLGLLYETERQIPLDSTLGQGHLSFLASDSHSRIWYSDGKAGMKCLGRQPASGRWKNIFEVSHGHINSFYQDRYGNYWFATDDQGAGYLSFNASAVRNLQVKDGLADNKVITLCGERDQNIWIGLRNGSISRINYTGINGITNYSTGDVVGAIQAIQPLRDGSVIAGGKEGVLVSRFGERDTLRQFTDVNDFAEGLNGELYIGTESGLFTIPSGTISALDSLTIIAVQVSQSRVKSVVADQSGGCWFGTDQGLYRYSSEGITYFGSKYGQLASSITDMINLPNGWMAIGTLGNGLVAFHLRDEKVKQFGKAEGLPSLFCNSLFYQPANGAVDAALWVATNRGLVKLSQLNLNNDRPMAPPFEYMTFNTGDGLLSDEINSVVAMRGIIYIATNRGLSIFNESDLSSDTYPPEIYITGVHIADRDTTLANTYALPFSRNSIRFTYTGISYKNRRDMHYSYRLRGLRENWRNTSSNEMNFSSLAPGAYVFEVKAVGKAGLSSPAPATISFRIAPPIYQRWWFLLLAGFTIAAIAFAIYKLIRTREERRDLRESVGAKTIELDKKIRELKRSNEELAQFAYIASHDLKEPLRNIANYIQLIQSRYGSRLDEDGQEYMDIAVNGVKRMYDMIGGLLSYSGLVNRDTSVAKVNTNALVDDLARNISTDPNTPPVIINRAQLPELLGNEEQIRLLFINLIDNGIKFNRASERRIEIDCVENDREYQFAFMDNGIGLDEDYADKVFMIFERLENDDTRDGSGIGLALCKKIVERHGGRIWYRSNEQGTTFHFTILKDLKNQLESLEQE